MNNQANIYDGEDEDHEKIGGVLEDAADEIKASESLLAFEALSPDAKFQRVNQLVQQSQIYSKIIQENMIDKIQEKRNCDQIKAGDQNKNGRYINPPQRGKIHHKSKAYVSRDEKFSITKPKRKSSRVNPATQPVEQMRGLTLRPNSKKLPMHGISTPEMLGRSPKQPAIVSGCVMKNYQIDGLEWLVSLYENGINGILADEMGLGKTLQCIALYGYLIEHGIGGPFLVVAPLTTISNWCEEFRNFAPEITISKYLGSKSERSNLKLNPPGTNVVITSYDMIIKDHVKFSRISWEYLTVDEGHRLKNFQSMLIQYLKKLHTGNRLLLTGTPLQNNLKELWSLLNFILPDIFHDLEIFESWFDFNDLKNLGEQTPEEKDKRLVGDKIRLEFVKQLHAILKPFLLRRVKTDVMKDLPPKKEYLIFTELTPIQTLLYHGANVGSLQKTILQLYLKEYLLENHPEMFFDEQALQFVDSYLENRFNNTPNSASRGKRVLQDKELSPKIVLQKPKDNLVTKKISPKSSLELSRLDIIEHIFDEIERNVKNLLLQNPLMQCRNICASHYTYYAPFPVEDIVSRKCDKRLAHLIFRNSAKIQTLEQLTSELIGRGHKVLVFSQFTKVLDLIALFFKEKGVLCSCLDGRMDQALRAKEVERFSSDGINSTSVFLLSTRAGGLGLNLTSADTVILFDSDWNPQMDLQAIDRVHRIGQNKPVKIFRLLVRKTVEELLIMKSFGKRSLEKMVIKLGQFNWGAMAQKEIEENIFSSDFESLNSLHQLEKRLNFLKVGITQQKIPRENEVLLGNLDVKTSKLTSEEISELMDRSLDCYKRDSKTFTNVTCFETCNNMDAEKIQC